METKIENWNLYLPIGTIESERMLYLLEFLSCKNINIFYINISAHIQANTELEKLDKGSLDGSKRSIASNDRSHVSDERSFSEKSSKNVDMPFEKMHKKKISFSNFEKKVALEQVPNPENKTSIPKVQKLMAEKTRVYVQLFMPTLQTDKDHFYHNQLDICYILLEHFGVSNKLGLLSSDKAIIEDQITEIQKKIDPEIKKLMSYLYLNEIDKEAIHKDLNSDKVLLNWNFYQQSLDTLIKELSEFFNAYLFHSPTSDTWDMTLAEVFLVCSLNRIYKFVFDNMFSKSWLADITNWFHQVSKRKDFKNAFGKFRLCKTNYISLLRDLESNTENEDEMREIDFSTWKIEDWKKHITDINFRANQSDIINKIYVNVLQKLTFGGFKGDNYYLWSFTYIAIEEEYRSRKNSQKAKDETSEFFDELCGKAQNNTDGFLLYLVLTSKCENLQGFVNTKKNFEPCTVHFGNYFVNSKITGFIIAPTEVLPPFMKKYEDQDLIEVKEIKENQNEWLENIIHRKETFMFEKVLNEKIF